MQGHDALTGMGRDEALAKYADLLLAAGLDERNVFANAMLAWAERESQETFAALRHVVFQAEFRRHANDYAETFEHLGAAHDAGLAMAKLQYLVVRLGQARYGDRVTVDNYETFFGPDIPATLATLYRKAVKGLLSTS